MLLNRDDYIRKMNVVLSDQSIFLQIGSPDFATIFRLEDKVNRALKQFKDESIISDENYQSLFCSGSSFGILYGLTKVHKKKYPTSTHFSCLQLS